MKPILEGYWSLKYITTDVDKIYIWVLIFFSTEPVRGLALSMKVAAAITHGFVIYYCFYLYFKIFCCF